MPLLVTPATIDTASTNATCLFAAAPIGGTPITAGLFMNKQIVKYYASGTPVAPVPGVPIVPSVPCVDPTGGTRILKPLNNKSVFFNKLLPVVSGDEAFILGTARPLVGPYGPSSVLIATQPQS